MTKIKRILSIALVCCILVFFAVFSGCSKKQEEPEVVTVQQEQPRVEPTAEPAVEETDDYLLEEDYEEEADMGEEPEEGVVDKGTPCKTHRYYIPAGSTETLSFEVHLKDPSVLDMTGEDLVIMENQWTEFGLESNIYSGEVETLVTTYPVWTVDGGTFYEDTVDKGLKPTILEVGNITIEWSENGKGTIKKIRGYGNPKEVGRYTENELRERLGDEMTITYTDSKSGKTYTWPLIAESSEEEVKFLKFDLNVTFPDEAVDIRNRFLFVGAGKKRWAIRASYSNVRNKYVLFGPATGGDCFGNE